VGVASFATTVVDADAVAPSPSVGDAVTVRVPIDSVDSENCAPL